MSKETIKPLEAALDYKGDYAYDFICEKIHQTIAIIKEQPPAGEFTKKNRDFIHDANRDFRAKRVKGTCIEDYVRALRELGEACKIIDRLEAELKRQQISWANENGLREIAYQKRMEIQLKLDRSEAMLKELLGTCEELVKFCYPDGKWRGWNNMEGILEIMQPIRRFVEKKERKL